MAATSKHARFYMTTVTFLVEDCLFKVPRGPFETQSPVFKDMFLLPVGDQSEAEGLSDARPIRLEGVNQEDFEHFLKFLFPRSYGQPQELPDGPAQWTSVLKLATLWDFDGVRKTAINALAVLPLSPVDKIVLATEYHIQDWLVPAINAMAQRPEPIGLEDVNRLGLDFALKIASVREHLALREVGRQINCYKGGVHRYSTQELIVGPRDPSSQQLDFTHVIHTTFNLCDDVPILDPTEPESL
ncbi:hypothetical protein HYDPIDRAFT_29621 [Hydnomerulius pinastri MD-312]|uniref:Unplaced genomic scaffold scaffold_17, whole genome shotgun sequence n=1 Tax=Hydnomerulius pinastri MD-312 TaxID=994086 RepID=A0A0C9WEI7_9AGAM|nr:hypothetical protein HYDPIDRAFT_29621 [Hydnomerulius pinastri MD-312]